MSGIDTLRAHAAECGPFSVTGEQQDEQTEGGLSTGVILAVLAAVAAFLASR